MIDIVNVDSKGRLLEIRLPEDCSPNMKVFCAFMAAKEYWGQNVPPEHLTSVRKAWDRLVAYTVQGASVTNAEALVAVQLVYYATCGKWTYEKGRFYEP